MALEERLKAFIEILKIVVWPAAVVWLFWYMRDEVKRAATRVTEIGFTGAKFAPPPEQIASSPATGVSPTETGSQQGTSQREVGLQEFIARLRQFISDDQLEPAANAIRSDLVKKFGANQVDQIEALVYATASLDVQLTHEKNYNVIYGSQLRLLEQMIGDVGVPPDAARSIFEEAKSAYPEFYRSATFEQWIAFLQRAGLCIVGQNGNYILTPYGRGFLKYIVDRHLPPNKPF